MESKRKFLSRREAAEYLGVSYSTLNKYATTKEKPLNYYKLGKNCMYAIEDLDRYIDSCKVEMIQEV